MTTRTIPTASPRQGRARSFGKSLTTRPTRNQPPPKNALFWGCCGSVCTGSVRRLCAARRLDRRPGCAGMRAKCLWPTAVRKRRSQVYRSQDRRFCSQGVLSIGTNYVYHPAATKQRPSISSRASSLEYVEWHGSAARRKILPRKMSGVPARLAKPRSNLDKNTTQIPNTSCRSTIIEANNSKQAEGGMPIPRRK